MQQKDLPKSEVKVLQAIVDKATSERAYGHLLKAQLRQATVWAGVSPDSLRPQLERIEDTARETTDPCLKAVYHTVLGTIYANNKNLSDSAEALVKRHYEMAMQQPELLAKAKTTDYVPLVVQGQDSRYFDNDLLSMIGQQTGRYDLLHAHYQKMGNTRATLLTALQLLKQQRPSRQERVDKSEYIRRLDSLAMQYSHLTEAGEVAIERFEYMEGHTTATAEEKVRYINQALDRWGSWKRMNVLRSAYQNLTSLRFHARINAQHWLPNQPVKLLLEDLRSVSKLRLKVSKVNVDGNTELNPEVDANYHKLKALATPLEQMSQELHFAGKQPWQTYTDSMTIPGLPVGVYLLEVTSEPASKNAARQLLFVTNLITLRHALPNGQVRFVVLNATTGQPVPRAKIELSRHRGIREVLATLSTDKNGEATYKYGQRAYVEAWAYTDDDRAQQPQNAYSSFYMPRERTGTEHIHLFADRAIYRPGQQVQVAAVAYRNLDGVENEAVVGKKISLQLRDANGQTVAEKEAVTDPFGTCTASFTLPKQVLGGVFTVRTANSSLSLRVEEYKRPTFQVVLPEVTQRYEAGDTLVIRGKASTYSGVPVPNAQVSYTVTRRPALWWWWRSNGSTEELFSEEISTDAEGAFQIELPLVLPEEALDADGNMSKRAFFYSYVASVKVTDAAGESHTAQMSVPLGTRKTVLNCDLPEQILSEDLKAVTFHLRNAAGQEVKTQVAWSIDGGTTQHCQTQESASITRQFASGKHLLTAFCEGDTLQHEFIVFGLNDKKPATQTHDWFYQQAEQWKSADEDITLQVGSSDKDVYLLYNIISGETLLESGHETISNALLNWKMRYKPTYGNGLLVTFAWVKEGQVYRHEARLTRPVPEKTLQMKWDVFRDRLTPGQEETWSLTITPPPAPTKKAKDAAPLSARSFAAQLMATLYDKSLDQLQKHQWHFTPYLSLPLPTASWQASPSTSISFYGYRLQKMLTWNNMEYDHIDESVLPSSYGYRSMRKSLGAAPMLMKSSARFNGAAIEAFDVMGTQDTNLTTVQESKMMASADAEDADEAAPTEEEADVQPAQMRENLQETAFFYPDLKADSTGRVVLRFRLPESLTTWRMMGLAHTADLCHGLIEAEAVAQKQLMISPNVPRFIREGDQATLQARITNTTDHSIQGTAVMQLVDPATDQVVCQERQKVVLKADTTVAVTFRIQVKKSPQEPMLIVRTSVVANQFSDGEQHYLPILPNTERVTQTLPFLLDEAGSHQIDFSSIMPEKQHSSSLPSRYSMEYTATPTSLVLMALPSMAVPENDNAISQATALYANLLGQSIANDMPGLKQAVAVWQREEGDEQTLQSQLLKNKQLKDIVLEETPWLADAKDETEQRHRLADFYDDNLMAQRIDKATGRLEELQLDNGAWSWWKHMPASYWTTVEVAKTLVRLKTDNPRLLAMQTKAIGYLAGETTALVKRMKAEEAKGRKQVFPGLAALEWLYICSQAKPKLTQGATQANDYLTNLLKKEVKHQSIYQKALTAIVLEDSNPKLAKQYAESLKQHTVYSPLLGRYYDTPRATYSWQDYRIPTQTAAIEALHSITPDDTLAIRQMQLWLVHEKRTQAWQTPLASINAIHAMLLAQGASAQRQDRLRVQAEPVAKKRALNEKEVKERRLTVEKTTTGTSWGAVYAQYWQPLDEVKDQKSGISVKREMAPLDSNGKGDLTVGDRIRVRITVTLQQDMDFVYIQDRRAACMEPVQQLSGYHDGAWRVQKDCATHHFFDRLAKGTHVVETDYYLDRPGTYQMGSCVVQCAYAPEFKALAKPVTINVNSKP